MDAVIKDYYKILGVNQDASEEKIRERWLELVKHHHPDLESGDVVDDRIKEINEAYQVLKQPLTRWEYDLQRTSERELGKSSVRRWAPLCGVLILILVAGGVYLIGTDILSELNSGPTSTMPQVSDEKVSLSTPRPEGLGSLEVHPEPGSSAPPSKEGLRAAERVSQPLPSKVAKETVTPKATKEEGVANADDKVEKAAKPLAPPVAVEKTVKVQEATVNAGLKTGLKNNARGLPKRDDISPKPVPAQSTKEIRVEPPARVKEQVALKSNLHKAASSDSVTETKPQPAETRLADHSKPSLVASEEEVRAFFGNYTMIYNQKNIEGFLSSFSPQAVQNQTDKYEEIKRIYTRFFRQSAELSYHIEGLKIEVYENGAEAKAQFQVEQVLRAGGERKIWEGSIRWVLHKENGALRIISLDYQNHKSL